MDQSLGHKFWQRDGSIMGYAFCQHTGAIGYTYYLLHWYVQLGCPTLINNIAHYLEYLLPQQIHMNYYVYFGYYMDK